MRISLSATRLSARGSALIEFIVLSIAMIPIVFMVPMLGKLIDLRHTTIVAGRYVAWEQAMGSAKKGISHSSAVVGSRFYSSPEAAIKTIDVQDTDAGNVSDGSGGIGGGVNPLWGKVTARESSGSATSFWKSFEFQDAVVGKSETLESSLNHASLGGVAGTVSDSIQSLGSALDFASGVRWDLPGGDYATGEVRVEAQVGNLLTPVSSNCGVNSQSSGSSTGGSPSGVTGDSTLCFTETTAILTDTWSVPATENVEKSIEEHTKAFVPASVLQPVGKFLSLMGRLKVVEELRGLEDAFGYVDAAPLPAGRSLGNYPESGR